MIIDVSASSNVGLVREQNEDVILVASRLVRDASYNIQLTLGGNERCIFALADGMGGHNAGEVASEETVSRLSDFFYALPAGYSSEELKVAFTHWIGNTHAFLKAMGQDDSAYQGMGTTLVGLCIYGGRVFWFNCGDSRLYCLCENGFTQLSKDHSYEQEGRIGEPTNIITNCVGAGNSVYVDMREIAATITKGNSFLLCSDGLSDLVDDIQLERLLKAGVAAPQFVKVACNAGGTDNVSVCVLRLKER